MAAVLAGIAALLAVFGTIYNPVLLFAAGPFAAAAGLMWFDGSGRLAAHVRTRAARRHPRSRQADAGGRSRYRRRPGRAGGDSTDPATSKREARRVLGVDAAADESTIRRAYRERARETHPDAEGGSEEAFKRATDAYDRLTGRTR